MNAPRRVAVDIGNSAAKIAWCGDDAACAPASSPMSQARGSFDTADWPARLVAQVPAVSTSQRTCWVAASVNRPALMALRAEVQARRPEDSWRELNHRDVPLRTQVRFPERVGVDRLLGAYEAMRLTGSPTVVTIDAGSAVTVDLVRDGCFMGGAILPGVRMQLAALRRGTDCLPEVEPAGATTRRIPGDDTESAMLLGVLSGIIGGIERLVDQYAALVHHRPPVVITGGDAGLLAPEFGMCMHHSDTLVLGAILSIADTAGVE